MSLLKKSKRINLLLIGIALALLIGCDADVFHQNQISISKKYALEYFYDGNFFFLRNKEDQNQQGGVLEGVILDIGWSKDFIICNVRKQFRGDADGFYVVNLINDLITGPYTMSDLKSNEIYSDIKLDKPEYLFKRATK